MPLLLCHTSTHTTPVLLSFNINQAVVEDIWDTRGFPWGYRVDVPAGASYCQVTIGVIQPVGLVSTRRLNFQGGIVNSTGTALLNTTSLSMSWDFHVDAVPSFKTKTSDLSPGGYAWHYHVDSQPGGGPSNTGHQFSVEILFYCGDEGGQVPLGLIAFSSVEGITPSRGRSIAQVIG